MFLDFFYTLRRLGVEASPTEWMTFLRALDLRLHNDNLEDFYYLARSLLVKDESRYDAFDQAFAEVFGDAAGLGSGAPFHLPGDEVLRWLENGLGPYRLTAEELARMRRLTLDELFEELQDRLNTQTGHHHGGHHWIGTGGTSPFGARGSHPTGISFFAEEEGGGGAVLQAVARRYRNLRSDIVLDVRQMSVALKRLRELRQTGSEEVLDVEATVDRTCRNGGEIELVFERERENQVRLVLAMDTGGSMEPHRRLCERLFSAADGLNHWKEFHAYYFHNCIYENLYSDVEKGEAVRVEDISRDALGRRLVIVGDAAMAPFELLIPNGTMDRMRTSDVKGIDRLKTLARAFPKRAWLNPLPEAEWPSFATIGKVQALFPMYPLTVSGLERAVRSLL